jgi:hypothetical protein
VRELLDLLQRVLDGVLPGARIARVPRGWSAFLLDACTLLPFVSSSPLLDA